MAGSVSVCVYIYTVPNLGNWAISLRGQLHLRKKESATQIAVGRAVRAEGTLWERVWCV